MRYKNFTPEDEAKFLELTSRGIVALFVYTNKVINSGKHEVYNSADRTERTVAYSGVVYAPVSLFSKFLGADVAESGKNITVTIGDKSVTVGCEKKIGYLPVLDTCRELGIYAETFCDGKFTLIGNKEAIDEIAENEALISAGTYVIFGEYDTDSFTDADYEEATVRFFEKLVGTKETNDINNPNVRAKLASVNENCAKALAGLDRSGDPPILWGTKLLHDTNDGYDQYRYVRWLAAGYATYGSDYYGKKEVLDDAIYALEWMYRHAYGEDMIAGNGWRDPKLPNWWHWYVGAPEILTDILFILHKEIPLEQRRRYLKCFVWITTWMCTTDHWYMSRLKICTKYGILLHDPSFLKKEQEDFDKTIELKRPDYLDYSHQYPHNISYGAVIPERALFIASLLSGTAIEYISPDTYTLFFLVKYMFDPAMYKGQGMFMLGGRHTSQMVEINSGASILSKHLDMLGMFGEDEDDYLKRFIKRHSVTPEMREAVIRSASFFNLSKYEDILADDSIPYDVEIDYAHSWYTGDRAAQHRNEYAFGIAMASKRHINYESILKENQNGWYTGDGAFHLYTSYDSHQYDGVNFMRNMNIAYRFPGTTEDMRERVVRGIGYNPWKAPNSFAGSMQIDNKYIAAGMEFISEYCHVDEGQYDEVRGWSRALHDNDLKAKKAWFCFDDEAVLLGAGITSTMNSPVNTIMAHRRIVNDDKYTQKVKCDKKMVEIPKGEFEQTFKNPDYILWEGHTGYVPLMETNLFVNRYNYTTNEEQPYLELRIQHGENPTNKGYAFAVIPYADEEKLEKYSKSPDVEIISNTDKIQAVREKNIGVSSYVFYECGKCEAVEVDRGAIVMLKDTGDGIEFSVCQPNHEETELTVKLNLPLSLVECDRKVAVSVADSYSELKISCEGAMGAPFRAKFKKI